MQSLKPKATSKTTDKQDKDNSSDDEVDPVDRMALLDEFAKRHGYNIHLYQQVSERTFRTLMKQHVSRALPVMKLSNIVVLLDEKQYGGNENQITTRRGKLKVTKAREKPLSLVGSKFLDLLITGVITLCGVPEDTLVRLRDMLTQGGW